MKTCYAAALALVGWYLMAPPTYSGANGSFVTKTTVPLRLWQNIGSYDHVADCDDERRALLDLKKTESATTFAEEPLQVKLSIVGSWSAICVATDDPRLKEAQ
jgi:hypothetical protein